MVSKTVRYFAAAAVVALLFGVVVIIIAVTINASNNETEGEDIAGRYSTAAISADGVPCAQIARSVLQQGGLAADATVAGLFCLGAVNPHSMGLGGGFFLTYFKKSENKVYTINARETAPDNASEEMFNSNLIASLIGGLAVAVPGELRGYQMLYEKFGGKIPWKDLISPTISLCEEGIPVSWHMAEALQDKKQYILEEPSLSMFVDPTTNDVLKENDTYYLLQLANTLRIIQDDPDALYSGNLTSLFVEDLKDFGGIITEGDMYNYTVLEDEPVSVVLDSLGGVTMYSVPAPSSGPVLSFILNILDGFYFNESSISAEEQVLTYQRIIESFKHAFGRRTKLGDPQCVDVEELSANMTSESYADSVRENLLENVTSQDPADYEAYNPSVEDYGTSHFSLVDAEGNAVSVTSTINSRFGALICSTRTGIIYNNEMDDFSTPNTTNQYGVPPSRANYIAPGKRPMSSMCPAILVDSTGRVRLVVGAAGGTKITTAVALTILNHLFFGKPLNESVEALRIHHQLYPMEVMYETGFNEAVIAGLEAKEHNVTATSVGGSVVGAVSVEDDGYLYAAADFRKSGEVDGY